MKIYKNGDFRHISGIFSRKKKISQKLDSAIFWTLLIRSLSKKSEISNNEIPRKCQKTVFSGIFPAFLAGKICFSKTGLGHILDIAVLHQCAKFHEKI